MAKAIPKEDLMKQFIKSIGGLGVAALALAALLGQPLLGAPRVWAQTKAPAGVEIPKGTPDALTAILTRRSIREYTAHPVPPELIKLLLAAGITAPSAFNEQSTEFVVVNDRKILDEIAKFEAKRPQLRKATVAIVVCGNQAKQKFKGQGYWQLDGAVASENILIAANALGLGAVWTAIYPYPDRIPKVQKLLNLPKDVIPLNIIPVGYPAERQLPEPPVNPARVHTNKW
jgi:nitroreductase